MADTQKQSLLDRIEAEARKVPKLRNILVLLALLAMPVLATIALVAAGERYYGRLSVEFLSNVLGIGSVSLVVILAFILIHLVEPDSTPTGEGKSQFEHPDIFQYGWGSINALLPMPVFFILIVAMAISLTFFGLPEFDGDITELFWDSMVCIAWLFFFAFAFTGLCMAIGSLVKKRVARLRFRS